MQELLLLLGDADKPQDEKRQARLLTGQLLYVVTESDPVRLLTGQLLYVVKEENL